MNINKDWHQKNTIPSDTEDKIQWHLEHHEVCGCREIPLYVNDYLENNIPQDLESEFKNNPKAKELFEKLSPSHRKEYAKYILETKKVETRQSRAAKTIIMILEKA